MIQCLSMEESLGFFRNRRVIKMHRRSRINRTKGNIRIRSQMILDRCGHGFSEELVDGDVTVKIMLIPDNMFHGKLFVETHN